MVIINLTEKYVKEGRLMVEYLLDTGLDLVGAFWLYEEKKEKWRLKIATDKVGEHGKKYVWRKVQEIIDKHSAEFSVLEAGDISPIKPSNKTLNLLETGVGSTEGIIEKRFRQRGIRAQYIEDALIYYLA